MEFVYRRLAGFRRTDDHFGFVELRHTAARGDRYERFVKPLLDRILAALLLVAFAPVMLLVTAVVWFRLGSPVLLRQRRIGKEGAEFSMLKFRTMQPCRRTTSGAYRGPERRVRHKSPDDPRLDPVGRLLRTASLDELPQLINVLRGDMSIVGPRPELAEIVERHYEPWQHARHAVKPGLTGLWQVTARASDERLMHELTAVDLEYTRDVSFRTDLSILVRTIPAVLGRQRGV